MGNTPSIVDVDEERGAWGNDLEGDGCGIKLTSQSIDLFVG